MKKIIVLFATLFVSVWGYSQVQESYWPTYSQAMQSVSRLKQVKVFPFGFCVGEDGHSGTFEAEAEELLQLTEEVYKNNPRSYNAAMNYATALLSEAPEGAGRIYQINAAKAVEAASRATRIRPNDIEAWALLDKAYMYKLFRFGRSRDYFLLRHIGGKTIQGTTEQEIIQVYVDNPSDTMARFQVFVNRLNLSDPSLSQADINESIYMLKAIGILKQRNVKEELLDQVNGQK